MDICQRGTLVTLWALQSSNLSLKNISYNHPHLKQKEHLPMGHFSWSSNPLIWFQKIFPTINFTSYKKDICQWVTFLGPPILLSGFKKYSLQSSSPFGVLQSSYLAPSIYESSNYPLIHKLSLSLPFPSYFAFLGPE